MDIDLEEPLPKPVTNVRRSIAVPVDDAHPFEFESYISNYSGKTAVDRIIHIVGSCPTLATEGLLLGIQRIYKLRDPGLYQALIAAYEHSRFVEQRLPSLSEVVSFNTAWADEVATKNQGERLKLEIELKNYTNNLIKESIRMAHRDLGDYFRATGDYPAALKHYTKSREFCTTSQHVLEMCLSVLELLIEQRNYSHIPTYIFKAEAALDATASNAPSNTDNPPGNAGSKKPVILDREKVQSKLDLATALSNLGQQNYEKAAYCFLKIGSPKELGDWIGKLVAPGDIAIYGVICALASQSRSAFKAQVVESPTFGIYIEQEPYIRDLIESFMSSNFKGALDVLNRYSTRHFLDIHLSTHVQDLMNHIRNKAVVLYFQPFSSIKLDRMSKAFGWGIDETELQVVSLIQSGDIQGRVDKQNKVLRVKRTDHRADLFAKAVQAGEDMQSANRKLLLRMRLQQADLVIRAPKTHHNQMSELLSDAV